MSLTKLKDDVNTIDAYLKDYNSNTPVEFPQEALLGVLSYVKAQLFLQETQLNSIRQLEILKNNK